MIRNSPSSLKSMAVDHNNAPKSLFLDTLYCEEEEEEEKKSAEFEEESKSEITIKHSLFEYDFCWDDEELQSLLCKERETSLKSTRFSSSCVFTARKQAVEFALAISSYHGFSASAAILSVNFVDRFLFDYLSFDEENKKPWLMQLVAVACLSLAAKVEETHVPLLVDLQVEDAKYLFEAKTIQRMELLILSALKWRMNPVTLLSFIDHFVRRSGLKNSCVIHLEFLRNCENTILSVISDSRFVGYFPSVLATATMLHVVRQVEYCGNAVECEKMIFDVLKISKNEVDKCYKLISDVVSSNKKRSKRKNCKWSSDVIIIDDAVMNSESANNRWQPILKKHKS